MKFVERALVVLLCLAMLVALHQIIATVMRAHGWEGLKPADWAAWVGAVGTVATLAGAIWIATGERRERERRDRSLGTITAAAFEIVMEDTIVALTEVATFIVKFQQSGWLDDLDKAIVHIKGIPAWLPGEAVNLVGVDATLAAEVARAGRVLIRIQAKFKSYGGGRAEYIMETIHAMTGQKEAIAELASSLMLCVEKCRDATRRV